MNIVNDERIIWVDIFKGILITLMVIGHTGSPWTPYIYLFHMPAFIFISGYTSNISKNNTFEYIKKKTLSLLLPFFTINSVYVLICLLLEYAGVYEYFYSNEFIFRTQIYRLFVNMYTIDLGGATWFIVVLYFIEIQYKIVYDICRKINILRWVNILCIGIFLIGLYLLKSKIYLPYYLDLSYLGIIFFILGIWFRKYKVFEEHIDEKIMFIISIIVFVVFGRICFVRMNWPTREFDAIFLSILTSICGIFLLYMLANLTFRIKYINLIFEQIGKKTYSILILHFLIFRVVFLIMYRLNMVDKKYLKNLVPVAGEGFWLILSTITIIICYAIAKIAEKNLILDYIVNAKWVIKVNKENRKNGNK